MNIKWDADKYTADFSFVHQYGNSVIELIDADKGSSVLDLGCGNVSEYATLLENTGFRVKYATLFDRPTELKGENGLKDWINMFVKTPFSVIEVEQVKEAIKDKAVEVLQSDLYMDSKWYADYVRIRMKAIRL